MIINYLKLTLFVILSTSITGATIYGIQQTLFNSWQPYAIVFGGLSAITLLIVAGRRWL